MGFGGIGVWQLLIILAIIIMLFGTKRLKSVGGDLGEAIKGFKNTMATDTSEASDLESSSDVVENQA